MELETWTAPPGDRIPNHPRFPVLVYRGVEAAAAGAEAARALFAEHGWGGSWVDGVFPFHHFHSTSHEVLAVVAGRATLELGGPQGEAFEVAAGDVLVLPAGTGHMRATARDGFTVVGAYPRGQEDYDLQRGDDPAEVAAARERIAALPAPPDDPVGGEGVALWR
ncbi:MAG: cupin domain-containing protein [Solirubrobacteraceae bacterium]